MGSRNSGRVMKRRTLRGGSDPLRGVDRRLQEPRAFLLRRQQVQADLGDDVPAVLGSVVQRFVFLESRVLAVEADALAGRPVDLPVYLSMVQTLTRLADRLGYQRCAKPAESLHDYMRRKSAASQPAPATVDASPSLALAGPSPAADSSTGGNDRP